MSNKISELIDKVEDFSNLPNIEKVKLLSFFYCTENDTNVFKPSTISNSFLNNDLDIPINISQYFSRLCSGKPSIFIKKQNGEYGLERTAKKDLDNLYLSNIHKQKVSTTLRDLLSKINGTEQYKFLEEAICCFEIKAYRASIIITWLLAIDAIYEYIIKNKLAQFNAAIQQHGKYKKIIVSSKDHFTDIKESDFIELLRVGKLITNDRRKILEQKLDYRNTCAHPNTIIIPETNAVAFIEDILTNIILVYSK